MKKVFGAMGYIYKYDTKQRAIGTLQDDEWNQFVVLKFGPSTFCRIMIYDYPR